MTENIIETIKDNIYKTIDVIVDQRIEDLKLDKTVKGTIQQCVNSSLGEYKINYNGGTIVAYTKPDDNTAYYKDVAVYINIPENNFSNKKWIIGKVSSISPIAESTDQSLSSNSNNYSAIGSSLILPTDEVFNLNSYSTGTQRLTLYSSQNVDEENKLKYQSSALGVYLTELEALKVHVEFHNSLPNEQKIEPNADYGLEIVLRYTNQNSAYKTKQDWWNAAVSDSKMNVITSESTSEIRDLSYYEIDWDQYGQDWSTEIQIVAENLSAFINNLSASKSVITIANLYLALLQDLQALAAKNLAKEMYDNWFKEINTSGKPEPGIYTFNTSRMKGNPFNYSKWTSFDFIIPIGDKELEGIDSITFYKKGFKDTPEQIDDNYKDSYSYTEDDLNIRNILITPVKIKSQELIDYNIIFNFEPTNILSIQDNYTSTKVIPTIYYKNQNITSACTFWWFKQDPTITISSEKGYQAYGGEGWRFWKNTLAKPLVINAGTSKPSDWVSNYNNVFKLVVMYNGELVATDRFFIINKDNQYDVKIISDKGTSFGYADESKTLTCEIDGQQEDIEYIYKWYRQISDGSDRLSFDKTAEEVQASLDDPALTEAEKQEKKNYLKQIEGITWKDQILVYPSSRLSGNNIVTVGCIVYSRQEGEEDLTFVGEGTIALSQGKDVALGGYYIEIENGSQVFQYSEGGTSPASPAASLNPQQPKKLTCKFYTPNKGLVNPSMYDVHWEYPSEEKSLIVRPTDVELQIDPRTGEQNILEDPNNDTDKSGCSFSIANNYNYNRLDNQIICCVTFQETEYRQATNFYFGKMGENGTNGTDVIARIFPTSSHENLTKQPLMLVRNLFTPTPTNIWNTTQEVGEEPIFEMKLYRNGTEISPGDYLQPTWSLVNNLSTKVNNSNNNNKNLLIISSDTVSNSSFPSCGIKINEDIEENDITPDNANLILKGKISLQKTQENNLNEIIRVYNQDYYCFYPIVFKQKFNEKDKTSVDKATTLREVIYNSSGYYPQYDANLGIGLNLDIDSSIHPTAYRIVYEAFGGERYKISETGSSTNDLNNPDFWIIDSNNKAVFSYTGYYAKESAETSWIDSEDNPIALSSNANFVKIRPKENYSGFRVNYVKVSIAYTTKAIDSTSSPTWTNRLCTYYIPFYFSLNTHELASLNGWDGNSVAIDDENGYILAPQMGAGIKDDADNTFTGIVMGIEQKSQQNNEIGLFGYNHGRRSIFLDAKTGNATFGLPEDNGIWEGRIELRPGGVSSIAGWKFDNTSLSKVASVEQTSHILTDNSSSSYYQQGNSLNTNDFDKNQTSLAKPYGLGVSSNRDKNSLNWLSIEDAMDNNERFKNPIKSPKGAKGAIPHDQQGIILNANPAYISVKGRPLGVNLDEFLESWGSSNFTRTNLATWRNADDDRKIDKGMVFKNGNQSNSGDSFISIGDSLEVELNPNSPSIFGIYRHELNEETPDGSDENPTWKRYLVSGIDEFGRFFSNAARDGSTSLFLGGLSAFGRTAQSDFGYKGSYVEDNKKKIFAFFVKKSRDGGKDQNCPVYLSTNHALDSTNSQDLDDEKWYEGFQGNRPLSLIARKISLYSGDNNNYDPYNDDENDIIEDNGENFTHKQMFDKQLISRLELDNNQVLLGYNITGNSVAGQLLLKYSGTNSLSKMTVPGKFEQTIGGAIWDNNNDFDLDRKYRIKVKGDKYEYIQDGQTNHIYAQGWYRIDSTTSPSTKVYYNPLEELKENDSIWSSVESVTTVGGRKYEKIKSNYRIDIGGQQIKAINGAAWEEEDLTSRAYQIKVNGSKYEYIKNYQTNHIYAAGWGTDNNGNSIHPANEIDSSWTGVASITTIGGSKYEKIKGNVRIDIGKAQTNNIGGAQTNTIIGIQTNVIGQEASEDSEGSNNNNYHQINTIYGYQNNTIYSYQNNLINGATWESGKDKSSWTLRTKVNGTKYEYIKQYQTNHIYAQGWGIDDNDNLIHPSTEVDPNWAGAASVTTVGGRKYEKIKGNVQIDIGGTQTNIIGSSYTQNIGNNYKQTVSGTYNQTVSGAYTQNINDIYKQTITVTNTTYTQTINNIYKQTVSNSYTQTVTSAYTQNIKGDHTQTVTGTYKQNINGDYTQSVTGAYTQSVTGTYNINIKNNSNDEDNFKLTINSNKIFKETQNIPWEVWSNNTNPIGATYPGWLLRDRLHISRGLVVGDTDPNNEGIQVSGKHYSIVSKLGLYTQGLIYTEQQLSADKIVIRNADPDNEIALDIKRGSIKFIGKINATDASDAEYPPTLSFGTVTRTDNGSLTPAIYVAGGLKVKSKTELNTLSVEGATNFENKVDFNKNTNFNNLTVNFNGAPKINDDGSIGVNSNSKVNFNVPTVFNKPIDSSINLINKSFFIRNDVEDGPNETKRIVGQFISGKPRLGIHTKNEDNSWSWKTYLAENKIVITEGTYLDENNLVITKGDERIHGWEWSGHLRLAVQKNLPSTGWQSVCGLDAETGFYGEGNGSKLKNTVDGSSSPSIFNSAPGYGGTTTIYIPAINKDNDTGRTNITTSSVSLTMPSYPDLSSYATRDWVNRNFVTSVSLTLQGTTLFLWVNGNIAATVVIPSSSSNSTE